MYLLALLWILAAVGVGMKFYLRRRENSTISTVLYLLVGWSILLKPSLLFDSLPQAGLSWLVMGGLAYTLGVMFYIQCGRRFFHAIWHLMVMIGTVCHFIAIMISLFDVTLIYSA